ncbi:type II toxin-antitoxin system HicB family antitoxin [uncultured Nostoc sp.]|uniref:type II toxin-antitoxin system HicB family antitoxin n=1 Tax=uncultured Nostoc sp. TaxID=340711 RepID=UPI0035CBA7B2
MKWRVILKSDLETGDWAVWCPELPGCTSTGETEEEVLENIKQAIQLYLQPESIELAPGAIIQEIIVS